MYYVANETLTIRIDSEMREALDAIASYQDRDRTYVVKEALRAYLEVYQWQVAHIRQGLAEADAGKFASDADMKKLIARLTGR
jgi:predicted transcriptional regulator